MFFKKKAQEQEVPFIKNPSEYISNIIFAINGEMKKLTVSVTLFDKELLPLHTFFLSYAEQAPNNVVIQDLNDTLKPILNHEFPTAKYTTILLLSNQLNSDIQLAAAIEGVPAKHYLEAKAIMSSDGETWCDLITETQGEVDRTSLSDYQAHALLSGISLIEP